MNILTVIIAVLLAIATIFVPRKWFIVPFIAAACLRPVSPYYYKPFVYCLAPLFANWRQLNFKNKCRPYLALLPTFSPGAGSSGSLIAPRFGYKSPEQCRSDIDKMAMPSHDPTGLFRVEAVNEFKYEPSFVVGAGWDCILRVGEQLPLLVVGECLYSYRINLASNNRSGSDRRLQTVPTVLKRAYARRDQNYTPREKKGIC